ncbi:hypothetical protein H206_05562 [Candidatus Electrothrix aarhusensis]|uniref:Uncharacterized protein n=1 Tax=Candidatus Electrothrix aarhusensis TaxID=1859131 RepID=A0A444J447_9BACT|nr:hypothetical protein H206_05562 [Candidatus Electrothrix aarhusensis]
MGLSTVSCSRIVARSSSGAPLRKHSDFTVNCTGNCGAAMFPLPFFVRLASGSAQAATPRLK